jgi:hypothetical protein
MEKMRAQIWCRRSVLAMAIALQVPARLAAQSTPYLSIPPLAAQSMARDFASGTNRLYCYYGRAAHTDSILVAVDSVAVVAVPEACGGVGLAYTARIPAMTFNFALLSALLEHYPALAVVTAIFRVDRVLYDGEAMLMPRTYSIIRGHAAGAGLLPSSGKT